MTQLVKFEVNKENVAIITLSDPDRLNALSLDMLNQLHERIKEINDEKTGARCLIITGEGRGFCAGANLMDRSGNNTFENFNPGDALEKHYHPMLMDLKNVNVPLITAVNGPAAGAGCSLAIFGDLVYASKSAYFYQAFKFIGLVPDASSTYVLPRKIGMARAMELSMIGEKLPAEKALSWGLINDVVNDEDLMSKVMSVATELAQGPTVAYKLIRHLYWDSLSNDFNSQLKAESAAQTIAGKTEDTRIGIMSFIQKTKPKFTGK